MAKYRIIAMDGGNGLNTAILLNDLQQRLGADQKDFLEKADLFAGTSFGAVNALFFAKHENVEEALKELFAYDEEIFEDTFIGENPLNLLGAFIGHNALTTRDRLQAFLIKSFGERTTLGELKRKVLVVTFQLDNEEPPPNRSWIPKIYNNFDGSPDLDELVVNVALRTSAFPIAYPIFQSITKEGPGFVDGAVVANNPAMIALAEVFNEQAPDDILLFSIGSGRNIIGKATYLSPPLKNGTADWGYHQWLFDLKNPFLLLDLVVQSSTEAVNFQCRQLLKEQFCRLDAVAKRGLVEDDPALEATLKETVAWLNASGWFAD